MNEILKTLGLYSVKSAIAILIVVVLTSAVKIPVKHAANKYAENGGNKSLINSLIVFICLVFSFAAALVLKLIDVNWEWSLIPWTTDVSSALPQWAIIFAGASSVYAIVWQSLEKGVSALFALVAKKVFGTDAGDVIVVESPAATQVPEPEAPKVEEKKSKKAKEEQLEQKTDTPIKYL